MSDVRSMSEIAAVMRQIARSHRNDRIVEAGIAASVTALNGDVQQWTLASVNQHTRRKHHARLSAALHAMANELERAG